MRNGKILAFGLAAALGTSAAQAQWVVSDPGNLAQGIINMAENIAHTSKTAVNTAESFAETVKSTNRPNATTMR